MKQNPLRTLGTFGQSVWLDYIRRDLIDRGGLRRLIEDDGLKGMASNPAIFEEAIAGGCVYDSDILGMAQDGRNTKEIYESMILSDVQNAADDFRPLYDSTDGADGYVSLEVDPHLAHDTEGTINEARRLWCELNRPNAFIKVPATDAGIPAVRELISDGINVNVTLIFGLSRYRRAAQAYIGGLEARIERSGKVGRVASVSSFGVSRIDGMVDPLAEDIVKEGGDNAGKAGEVLGQTAVSSAKMVYQAYKEIFSGGNFMKLADKGARVQRLLWTGTSTKNPAYSDVKYVDSLIGPGTITAIRVKTYDAYRDHGMPGPSLEKDLKQAGLVLKLLPELGIDLDKLAQQLEDEGVKKFVLIFDKLMATLKRRAAGLAI